MLIINHWLTISSSRIIFGFQHLNSLVTTNILSKSSSILSLYQFLILCWVLLDQDKICIFCCCISVYVYYWQRTWCWCRYLMVCWHVHCLSSKIRLNNTRNQLMINILNILQYSQIKMLFRARKLGNFLRKLIID